MTIFSLEQYKEAKEQAKGLGINVVGKSKQVVVDLVNAALAAQTSQDWTDEEEDEDVESELTETGITNEQPIQPAPLAVEEEIKEEIEQELKEDIKPEIEEEAKLPEQAPVPEEVKPQGSTLEDYGFTSGEIAFITGRAINGQKVILANRKIELVKVSKKPGMFNGHLIHDKTGLRQKCEIAIPIEIVIKLEIPVEEVAATEEEAAAQ